jgi:hypothetical protein
MNRIVKSILAVATIAGAGLAAMLTADAQRTGPQKWAADGEALVYNASTGKDCRGCPWRIAPRGRDCSRLCRPDLDCESGTRYNGHARRCECPRGSDWNGSYCHRPLRPLGRPKHPHVPAQPPPSPTAQPQPAQPQCPPGAVWTSNTCLCPPGTGWNGSQCLQCDALNAYWDGNGCQCRPGTNPTWPDGCR